MIRKCVYCIVSLALSAALIISIPLVTLFIKEGFSLKKEEMLRKTEVRRMVMTPQKQEKKEMRRRPRKRLSPRTSQQTGPRFAMDLGAQGIDGVGIELNMLNAGTAQAGSDDDGVDQRPKMQGDLQVNIPEAVKQAEVNAQVRLMFCVDIAGRPYDIRVSGEEPAGSGLAQAGREALARTVFSPAIRNGQAVPFCGMEQPIEIKFRN